MAKYKRPLTEILNDVVSGMNFNMEVLSVTDNGGVSQTLFCCDIFHAQKKYFVTIEGKEYKIIDFSQEDESITVEPTFIGDPTIVAGTIFSLYRLYFFYGTPISTQTQLNQIKPIKNKTPMYWLWENFEEQITEDEMIERTIPVELYALTDGPNMLDKMTTDQIRNECSKPMQRAIENLMNEIKKREDIFDGEFLKYSTERFANFGVMAKNQGATKAVFMDKLSGVAGYTTLELYYKDACECPAVEIPSGIGYDVIGSTIIL